MGCANHRPKTPEIEPENCSTADILNLAAKLDVSDGAGHGPDIGSAEWRAAIEFRMGITESEHVHDNDTKNWCQFIESILGADSISNTTSVAPSFDCALARPNSMEAIICDEPTLALLDVKLSNVYLEAIQAQQNSGATLLRAEQRGWLKGRDDCWKAKNKKACLTKEYKTRVAQLQAQYKLISARGPFFYHCENNPANEIVVTFYQTDPEVAVAERGDRSAILYRETAASGAKYVGRNEQLWLRQNEASVIWGYDAPIMNCLPDKG